MVSSVVHNMASDQQHVQHQTRPQWRETLQEQSPVINTQFNVIATREVERELLERSDEAAMRARATTSRQVEERTEIRRSTRERHTPQRLSYGPWASAKTKKKQRGKM